MRVLMPAFLARRLTIRHTSAGRIGLPVKPLKYGPLRSHCLYPSFLYER
jgi:hypothetical protein